MEHRIFVYSQPDCPKCDMVKEFLKNAEHDFVECDITKDEAAHKVLLENNFLSTPVTQVMFMEEGKMNTTFVTGFNLVDLSDALDALEG